MNESPTILDRILTPAAKKATIQPDPRSTGTSQAVRPHEHRILPSCRVELCGGTFSTLAKRRCPQRPIFYCGASSDWYFRLFPTPSSSPTFNQHITNPLEHSLRRRKHQICSFHEDSDGASHIARHQLPSISFDRGTLTTAIFPTRENSSSANITSTRSQNWTLMQ